MPMSATARNVTVGIPTRNRSSLLRRAIASVLAQSYRDFTLVVSDNASDDATAEVVASFDDPRIVYRPLDQAIGRAANFNRLIELTDADFLVALGDDDELHPEHLSRTVETLRRWPSVGVVHTAYEIVDMRGTALAPTVRSGEAQDSIALVSGARFIERSMSEGPRVCLSSALFRRAALLSAGGWRSEDGVIDDLPLLMRLAAGWDFAYLDRPLALMQGPLRNRLLIARLVHSKRFSVIAIPSGHRPWAPAEVHHRGRPAEAGGSPAHPDRGEGAPARRRGPPLDASKDGRWHARRVRGARERAPT